MLSVGQHLERSLVIDEGGGMHRAGNPNAPVVRSESTWTPQAAPPRKLTDLMYIPHLGQSHLEGGYIYAQTETTVQVDATKDKQTDSTVTGHTVGAEYMYGFTDHLAFGVQRGYLLGATNRDVFNNANGVKQTAKSSGFLDPELKLKYRWVEQDT